MAQSDRPYGTSMLSHTLPLPRHPRMTTCVAPQHNCPSSSHQSQGSNHASPHGTAEKHLPPLLRRPSPPPLTIFHHQHPRPNFINQLSQNNTTPTSHHPPNRPSWQTPSKSRTLPRAPKTRRSRTSSASGSSPLPIPFPPPSLPFPPLPPSTKTNPPPLAAKSPPSTSPPPARPSPRP